MPEQQATRPVTFERIEDFAEDYANNVRFESTVVDLKLIFGQSDLHTGSEVVIQHTSITLPWPVVKTMIYYLAMNVVGHEIENGKITIPPSQIPALVEPPTEEQAEFLLHPQELYEAFKNLRERFVSGKLI